MSSDDIKRKILDAVDAGFDAQLATTRDFVAIPSTRGAEGPCQDMIGEMGRITCSGSSGHQDRR